MITGVMALPNGHRTSFPPPRLSFTIALFFLCCFLVPFLFFSTSYSFFLAVATCLLSHSISIIHRTPCFGCVLSDPVPINPGSLAVLLIASLSIYPHHSSTLLVKSPHLTRSLIAVLQKDGQLYVGGIRRGVRRGQA